MREDVLILDGKVNWVEDVLNDEICLSWLIEWSVIFASDFFAYTFRSFDIVTWRPDNVLISIFSNIVGNFSSVRWNCIFLYNYFFNHQLGNLSPWLEYWIYFVEFFFIFCIFLIILVRLIFKNSEKNVSRHLLIFSLIGLCLELIWLIIGNILGWQVLNYGGKTAKSFFHNSYLFSNVVFGIRVFICIIAIIIFLSILDSLKYDKIINYDLPIIMLINIEALFLMASVNDYFLMFLVLELQSLSLYLLVSLNRSNLSVEAGLNIFCMAHLHLESFYLAFR